MSNIRSFVSHLPRQLLGDFLRHQAIAISEEELAGQHQVCAEAIKREADLLPSKDRGKFDHEVERIELMRTEFGEIAIRSVSVHDHLSELQSRHARAVWIYLNDPEAFLRAEEARLNDLKRGGRDWTTFVYNELRQVSLDPSALERFKSELRSLFDCEHVHVEIFDRSRMELCTDGEGSREAKLTQITIYREAPPNTEWAFSPEGVLGTEIRRSVLEASVTYDPKTGYIECVSRHTDSRQQIARAVATNLLGCKPDFHPATAQVYDLKPLRESFAFETEPLDRIEKVRVASMRLTPLDTVLEFVTLESKPTNPRDIWTIASERLGPNALQTDYEIAQAKIVIRYRSSTSNHVRSLPIVITPPNRSNLREHLEIERLVASKYLPRWQLVLPNER